MAGISYINMTDNTIKRFNHICPPKFKDSVNTKHTENAHYYESKSKRQKYTGITTLLSKTSDKVDGLNKWRKGMDAKFGGAGAARYIMVNAGIIGTAVHTVVEEYLKNEYDVEKKRALLVQGHFDNLKPLLDKIDNIHFNEVPLISNDLRVGGTCDCIAEYDGKLSIIDFKTARSDSKKRYSHDYRLQATAYSIMYEELTGIKIDQGVILMTSEEGGQFEIIFDVNDYKDELLERVDKYHKQ